MRGGNVNPRGSAAASRSRRAPTRAATTTRASTAKAPAKGRANGATSAAREEKMAGERRRGRFSSSLQAGLAILNCFSSEQPVLGIAQLAEQLSMSRSTTHRYASTLVALGYLEQDAARRYRLAPRVADIGMSVLDSMTLRRAAREHLRELREQTGRTASLAVLDEGEVRYVDRLRGWRRGQHAVDLDLGAGARVPATCTAMGKVLLAYLPDAERERAVTEAKLTRRGPNSITSKRALRAELEQVRKDGLAMSDEEMGPGVRTIAAPVLDADGNAVAAVGLPVPAAAFSLQDLRKTLGPPVLAAAKGISAALRAAG
jgi:IclR family pca regulon transcriptional regulator